MAAPDLRRLDLDVPAWLLVEAETPSLRRLQSLHLSEPAISDTPLEPFIVVLLSNTVTTVAIQPASLAVLDALADTLALADPKSLRLSWQKISKQDALDPTAKLRAYLAHSTLERLALSLSGPPSPSLAALLANLPPSLYTLQITYQPPEGRARGSRLPGILMQVLDAVKGHGGAFRVVDCCSGGGFARTWPRDATGLVRLYQTEGIELRFGSAPYESPEAQARLGAGHVQLFSI